MKEVTAKNLSQLRYLKKEIAADRERVKILQNFAEYGAGGGSVAGRRKAMRTDRTGRFASEIAYLTDMIAENMKRAICELLRLQTFIHEIENSEMRCIFHERYIKGRSWTSIAVRLGYQDEQVPRRKHDRFLCSFNERAAAE